MAVHANEGRSWGSETWMWQALAAQTANGSVAEGEYQPLCQIGILRSVFTFRYTSRALNPSRALDPEFRFTLSTERERERERERESLQWEFTAWEFTAGAPQEREKSRDGKWAVPSSLSLSLLSLSLSDRGAGDRPPTRAAPRHTREERKERKERKRWERKREKRRGRERDRR